MSKDRILFSEGHGEQLVLSDSADTESSFAYLGQLLNSWDYASDSIDRIVTSQLINVRVLVIGAPQHDFESDEINAIEQFVKGGGGLLILSNAETMFNPPSELIESTSGTTGLHFQEYLNYPITYLQVFQPHFITANVKRVRVGDVASLSLDEGARLLASTRATKQPVMACACVGSGRVVAMGDLHWLCNDLLGSESNETLARNTFQWLSTSNAIDIEKMIIPETVELGQTVEVVLHLQNRFEDARPQIECVLESDADASVSQPTRKKRSLPPGKTSRMQWAVRPQVLGEQELRLSLYFDDHESLFFDRLPEMHCLAPGYLTLKVESQQGDLKTSFETGDCITVEGAFHWKEGVGQPSCRLDLQIGEGLIESGREPGDSVTRWYLQAVDPGAHQISLELRETGQSLPAVVKVVSSYQKRLAEIQAAYIYPLEAEIAERLGWVDERFRDIQILSQLFTVLSPEDFVRKVYVGKTASWLEGVLASARREQWYNPKLLELVLIYIAPTYVPNYGTYVPFDPILASYLAQLHPGDSKALEYNFLCSEESEEINVKQNVATYLLHEKFGHGFFYTQTQLGQQLALLQRHGFLDMADQCAEREAAELLEESAIVVNEGFAAWMELTFLRELDREVRQAAHPRRVLLIQQASGLFRRELDSDFFQKFRPRFDSRYREGFEYLDLISQKLNPHCAIRAFLIAADIDFGITESRHGELRFDPLATKHRLLESDDPKWKSHLRLRRIATWLYEHGDENNTFTQEYARCARDCRIENCPIEDLVP